MSRALLITGATGKQGSAVINALLARQSSEYVLLAATRNAQSAAAKRLASRSPNVKLVEGDLNSVSSLIKSAKEAAGTVPLWGVYSVQASMGKGVTLEGEVKQGKGLIDESLKAGVQHFVYSSVERGGDEKSWENPTPVPHFKTKHEIEHHLRDATAKSGDGMGWTVLRPTIFMDNLAPGFAHKVLLTLLRDTLKEKPLQWIATEDIGFFAAEAFSDPASWNRKAVGLAGDELTFSQLSQAFSAATGTPAGTTFSTLGKLLKLGVPEMGAMLNWFKDEGYNASLDRFRKVHPGGLTFDKWLRKSAFAASK